MARVAAPPSGRGASSPRILVGVLAYRPSSVLVSAALLAALAAPVRAGDGTGEKGGAPAGPPVSTPLEEEVKRLLEAVASDDFTVRENARKALAALGASARPALEARREDKDPEIRRAVASLLDAMGAAEPAPGPAADFSSLDLVTLSGEAPLVDALHAWEAARGGRFRFAGAPPAAAVRLDAAARPWFEVLDGILRQGGVGLLDGFDQAGVADVVPLRAGAAPLPVAYVGPLKLEVETVSATRRLKESGPRSYSLGMRLSWAPDVQVVSSGLPILEKATDGAGRAFVSRTGSPDPYFVRSFGSSRRVTDLTLTLDRPAAGTSGAEASETLSEARISIRLRVRHGKEEVRFDDLAGLPATKVVAPPPPPRGLPTSGGKVTLESLDPDPDHAGWWLGRLVVRLPPGVPGESVLPLVELSDGSVRALFDYQTRSVASDGVMQLTVRTAGLPVGASPKAVTVSWLAGEGQGAVTFVLKDVPLR